ncbi:hypothetical protein KBA73_01700 [Patescibacteria group bacterium]|nr:hypothetical protein [Patescibacteria group bacterium]
MSDAASNKEKRAFTTEQDVHPDTWKETLALKGLLKEVLKSVDINRLFSLEAYLQDLKDRQAPFGETMRYELDHAFLELRYAFYPRREERLVILDRLEAFMGIHPDATRDSRLGLIKRLIYESLTARANAYPDEVARYLDEVLTHLASYGSAIEDDWLMIDTQTCLHSLARSRDEKVSFLEQAAIAKKWNLFEKDPLKDNRKEYGNWIARQVSLKGLSFDASASEESLQCFGGSNYRSALTEHAIRRRREKREYLRDPLRVVDSFEELADIVVDEYASPDELMSSSQRALSRLLEVPTRTEFKERLFIRLIQYVDRGMDETLVETALKLDLPPDRLEEVMQEIYAYHIRDAKRVPDGLVLGIKIPIRWDHPAIYSARLGLTRQIILEQGTHSLDFVHTNLVTLPCTLLYQEWPTFLQQALEKRFLQPQLSKEHIIEYGAQWVGLRKIKESFERSFHEEAGDIADNTVQLVLRYADEITQLCKQDKDFSKKYQRWLAECVGENIWSFSTIKDRPGSTFPNWPAAAYHTLIRGILEDDDFETLDDLIEATSGHEKKIQSYVDKGITQRFSLAFEEYEDSAFFMSYVLKNNKQLLESYVLKTPKNNLAYQEWVANVFAKKDMMNVLEEAPLIDFQNEKLQIAIGKSFLGDIRRGEFTIETPTSPRKLERARAVRWQDPEIKEDIAKTLQEVLVVLGMTLKNPEKDSMTSVRQLETVTGYRLTDLTHWGDIKDLPSLTWIMNAVEGWRALAAALGAHPGDEAKLVENVQGAVDEICANVVDVRGTVNEFILVKRKLGIQPSEASLRVRFVKNLTRAGSPLDVPELLQTLGVSLTFTVDEIRTLPDAALRTEALFATMVLPKGGPERAAAEKALRARSWVADLVPQLLAIQSPTRREEFCSYKNILDPLLTTIHKTDLSLEKPDVQKSLLFFLQRFGVHYAPTVAMSVMRLFLQTQQGRTPVDESPTSVRELRAFLGIEDNEHPSFEGYLERIESLIAEMRQMILEDRPMEERIERSALGMELFNTLVPHVGSYMAVDDRPKLLAEARQNNKILQVDPLYVALEKPVRIANDSLLGEETSLGVERRIRACQEQASRKFKDESLQHLLGSWEDAAVQLELEPTGGSRAYWFSILQSRLQVREQDLTNKLQKLTNPIGQERATKERSRIQTLLERVTHFTEVTEPGTPEQLLEELQSLYMNASGKVDRVAVESEAGDIARSLTLSMMRAHSPLHFETVKMRRLEEREHALASSGKSLLTPRQVIAWAKWFTEEYIEHFAGIRDQAQVPLSEANRRLMQKLWRIDGLEGDIKKWTDHTDLNLHLVHPILTPVEAILELSQEIKRLEERGIVYEEKPVGFWPVKGIGRALAGDIADACYHGYRDHLIRGGFPGITAVLTTLPGQPEIAGSTLFIDAKTVDAGKRVLVIRALNPTEAVTRRFLDARSYVEATIEYAKEVAQRSQGTAEPIEEIRLCYDQRGGHSTNRTDVFQAMQQLVTHYKWSHGSDLQNTPETNFNGYRIYGGNETRVVWRVKHP